MILRLLIPETPQRMHIRIGVFLPPTFQISLSGVGQAGTGDKFEDTLKMQHVGNHILQSKDAHSMTPLRCNMCASTNCHPVMYMA